MEISRQTFVATSVTALAAYVGSRSSPCLGQTDTGAEPAGEDGSRLWLRYPRMEAYTLPRYVRAARGVLVEGRSQTARVIREEVELALTGMLGNANRRIGTDLDNGAVLIGTIRNSATIRDMNLAADLAPLGPDFSEGHIRALQEEGYSGVTTYHEWGAGIDGQVSRKLFSYEDVVRQSAEAWERKNRAADGLMYYPLVDTGWDSRPWHGYRAMVIQDRTPRRFEDLLRRAGTFCRENGKGILILGPVNEWGEGSYIEPCTEFGFEMLEAVRRTFATGLSRGGPVNTAPADVGLGPCEYPIQQP